MYYRNVTATIYMWFRVFSFVLGYEVSMTVHAGMTV